MKFNPLIMFNFKREIGIADLFSFLAIAIAGISLYQSNKALEPYLVLGLGDSNAGIIQENETKKCLHITQIPVILNNSGQKSALLSSISLPKNNPAALFSLNNKMLEKDKIKQKIFLLQGRLQHIQDWGFMSEQYDSLELQRPVTIQKIIPPNSSYSFYFLLSSEIYRAQEQLADRIYVGINLKDGEDKTYEMRVSISIPENHLSYCY